MGTKKDAMKVTILGTRGSIPICSERMHRFGGATSCYMVEAGDQTILLDAGLGIVDAAIARNSRISILITHPHLDHLLGLPFFPGIYEEGRRIDYYAATREGLSAAEQLDLLYAPPFWPCRIGELPAQVSFHDIAESFQLGIVMVHTMEVPHPGGATAYKLVYGGSRLVYLTDYEQGEQIDDKVMDFVRDAELMLCDAQYTDEEYDERKGYGHSTASKVIALKEMAGVKNVLLIHHDPFHDDDFMDRAEAGLLDEDVRYARQGEVIIL